MRRLLIIFAVLVSVSSCTSLPEGVKPVKGFEADRYLGTWYEIARFDHSFESGLSQVTANYSMREDGGIRVVNRGFDAAEGQWDEATGKAYFVKDEHSGYLKVSFFGPFYASYVVAELDKENYSYSLVTGPDKTYLWILSRTPALPKSTLDKLLKKAESMGFDTSKLIWVSQKNSKS